MQKYKSNITSTSGAAIRNVPVTVLNEAGELASLFLDRAGDIAAQNPLVTDSTGNFYFYAVNGRYSLRTTVDGVTITDNDVVLLQDPEEITVAGPIAEAVAAAQAAAQQAQQVVESSGIPDMVAAAQNAVIDSNQALQEARSASQASAQAKQAAESAKSAAELAKGDAQSASTTANAAAQQANASAQSAAQSAASIDPARLLTPAERQKLDSVEAGATKNFAVTLIAPGTNLNSLTEPGFYFCDSSANAASLINSPFGAAFGLLVENTGGGNPASTPRRRQTATQDGGVDNARMVRNCREGVFTAWVPAPSTALASTWTAQQRFDNGAIISRLGISGAWSSNVGVYCLDNTFSANANYSGVNMDISSNGDTLTATRTHRAAYLRVRSNNTSAQLAGFTNGITGVEGVAELSTVADGVGEATFIYGVRGYATDNSARTQVLNGAYAGWFNSQHTGTTAKATTESIAVLAQVTNSNASSTLTRATGIHTAMVNTAGTITTGYIYRGTYTGAGTYGVKWGIHLAGSTQNQIDGWLSLTDTTESTSTTTGALRVAGGLGVVKNLWVGGNLELSETAKSTIRNISAPFATYGGTANAITLTNAIAQVALVRGQSKVFRATAANTGAVTINMDGLGAVSAVTVTGVALPAGYIRTDVDTVATFNGTNWVVDRQVQYGSNANGNFVLRNDGSALIMGAPGTVVNIAANTPYVFSGYAMPTSISTSKPSTAFAQINPTLSPDFMYGYGQVTGGTTVSFVGRNGVNTQNAQFVSYVVNGYWY
jgi:hypothetical protein